MEIGTFDGGSLEFLEAWAEEIHSFDLDPQVDPFDFPSTTFHVGDSRVLVPEVLARFAAEGRNVDFALVDGDHSAEGVRADVEALLGSPAVGSTLIVLHDTMNEAVRAGIAAAALGRRPGVVHVDLDLLEVFADKLPLQERWSGLGVIVVERDGAHRASTALPSDSRRRQRVALATAWEVAAPARRLRRAAVPPAVRLFRRLPPVVQSALRRRRATPWRRPAELELVDAPDAPVRR